MNVKAYFYTSLRHKKVPFQKQKLSNDYVILSFQRLVVVQKILLVRRFMLDIFDEVPNGYIFVNGVFVLFG